MQEQLSGPETATVFALLGLSVLLWAVVIVEVLFFIVIV